ncbi:MAG: AAA family ATPase [Segniliparus sp.]|uniref:AAA family ATPase n=1 Tax=Segniliparus sp. TaxID=2804064 RepID=UPI003F30EE88
MVDSCVDEDVERWLAEFERAKAAFPMTTLGEAARLAEVSDPWLVPGLVAATSTLLYGEAKVGKSWLVAHLVAALATGGEFLGVRLVAGDYSVALALTDDAGREEYGVRIGSVVSDPGSCPVGLYRIGVMNAQRWGDLFQVIRYHGHNVVVIDNLTQALDGSINDDAVVRRFFEGVRLFTAAGIAVVVVGHSSDKANANGFKPSTPMGSAYVSQAVRWIMHVRKARGGRLGVRTYGNLGHGDEFELEPGAGARFEVAARRERPEGRRPRSAETLDRNAQMADWVVAHCQGVSQNKTAEALAEQFGGSAHSYRTWLRPGGKLGSLIRRDGERWERVSGRP